MLGPAQEPIATALSIRQPTIFLDLALAPVGTTAPDDSTLPTREQVELVLVEQALQPFLGVISSQRAKEIETIATHMEISLNELIHRQKLRMADLLESQNLGETNPLLAANIKTTEDRIDELNSRLERRREELQQERRCTITDIQHYGRAWALPHPERTSPGIAPMVRDEEIERIAAWKDQSAELVEKSFEKGRDSVDAKTLMQSGIAARSYVDVYNKAKTMNAPVIEGQRIAGIALILVKPDQIPNVSMKTAQPVETALISEDVGI